MRGASAARTVSRSLATSLALALLAPAAPAVEFFDDRAEIHGFYEAQVRSLVRDYDFSDDWDLAQWWNVLNLEIEANLAPEGFGPFEAASVFARIEVRYDCIWTRGCSIFDSANAYGNNDRGKLPKRLVDARRTGYQATNFVGDERHFYDVPITNVASTADDRRFRPDGHRVPLHFWQTTLGAALFGEEGMDNVAGTPDDPSFLYFDKMTRDHCDRWGQRKRENGPINGRTAGEPMLLDPGCNYDSIGAAADDPNPFRANDLSPLTGIGGSLALPYRPAPVFSAKSGAPLEFARGAYYPNARLQQMLRDGDLEFPSSFTDKLRRGELAWNRGVSPQEQKELKELYVDIEMFESRLFLRIGYQTIVWGKTELFRNQDQFNPQDAGLASLPSLEESRISLWAIKAIWSFYDVGPLNDVRIELAMNYDQYQPTDFGVCGEPYAPLPICTVTTGLLAHGYFGVGLAGADFPEDPWNDAEGIEGGVRLEFRWDRFSFAITDFYGYQDVPYADRLFTYSRNVDPVTGRPRHTETTLVCRDEDDAGCLDPDEALESHSANQQLFAFICGNTIGFSALDPTVCALSIFGSPARTDEEGVASPRVVVALNSMFSGDFGAAGLIYPALAEFPADGSVQAAIASMTYNGQSKVLVNLNIDPNDGGRDYPADHPLLAESDFLETVAFFYSTALDPEFPGAFGLSLSARLTDQQEALVGCGKLFRTSCDLDGIDLLNAEASVLFQSFPNVQGTFDPNPRNRWDTTDRTVAQPGTVGFQGGPACTRVEGGKTYILPGCRGLGDEDYDPRVDGTVTGLLHPFTGQQFQNEMAVMSWNFLMVLIASSLPPREPGVTEGPRPAPRPQDFDVANPFRRGACSFREPEWCSAVPAALGLSGQGRNDIRAGGNGMFGRRDFVWHSGGQVVLRSDKANVLGFSMDFAEDVTKSNWGIEFTWVEGLHVGDNDSENGLAEGVDLYRLTISVDRPTFVNFLNANRTFFINTQWFFQYTDEFRESFSGGYQWDIFGVIAISTGYFQDRLIPSLTLVYFVKNNSFAVLPQLTYRYTENFAVSFGLAAFAGREQERVAPINPIAPHGERFGRNAYKTSIEPAIAAIRERDEIYLRIRYTF
jgi:hypothetical protein